MVAADRYLTAEEKAQYEEQQLAAVGLDENVPLAEPPQAMWQEAADTVQAAPSITPAEITKADIESALQLWNGDTASKRRVTEYMESHSRERGTAEWLKNEFGGNLPAFTVTKGDLSLELPWAKVQRHIGQLVAEEQFFTDAEYDNFADVDFGELKERLASDEPSPFVEQVISDAERIAAELTLEMYDTESTDLFQVKRAVT